jgi:hypothetical protein
VQPKSLIVAGGLAAIVLSWETARLAIMKQYRLSISVVTRDSTKWYPYYWGNPAGCPLEVASEAIDGTSIIIMRPSGCSGPPPRHLFVVGDSHAGAYIPMFSLLAGQDGVDVRLYSRSYCSFANLLQPTAPNCASFVRVSADDVVRRAAPGDVVFLAALRMNRLGDEWGPFTATHVADLTTSRALPWFESYTDQDWISKMRCDTIVNEQPTLTADMIGFTVSVV